MGTFSVKSLGCKANWVDGQVIEAELLARGWVRASHDQDPDLAIVNSCTVTDEADKQSKRTAKILSKKSPKAVVVYTGCGAEVNPDKVTHTGVQYVVGNQDKDKLVDLVLSNYSGKDLKNSEARIEKSEAPQILGKVQAYEELRSQHPIDREWFVPSDRLDLAIEQTRTRAFLKIQDGCNSFCTYCIIPYGRGPARSLSVQSVVEQVKALVSKGIKEIVLTGTNLGDFGVDWAGRPVHDDLVEAILNDTAIERLRVSSLDPTEITEKLFRLAESSSRFCPHFHVSLQATGSKILRLMKRKYKNEQVVECLGRIESISKTTRPVFVGMDLITGFPGETEADFNESVEALSSLYWSRLHVFPYSEREGTPATRLTDQIVSKQERSRRADVLRDLSLSRLESIYQKRLRAGDATLSKVLWENFTKGPDKLTHWVSGYSPEYFRVMARVSDSNTLRNTLSEVSLDSVMKDSQAGEMSFIVKPIGAVNFSADVTSERGDL